MHDMISLGYMYKTELLVLSLPWRHSSLLNLGVLGGYSGDGFAFNFSVFCWRTNRVFRISSPFKMWGTIFMLILWKMKIKFEASNLHRLDKSWVKSLPFGTVNYAMLSFFLAIAFFIGLQLHFLLYFFPVVESTRLYNTKYLYIS